MNLRTGRNTHSCDSKSGALGGVIVTALNINVEPANDINLCTKSERIVRCYNVRNDPSNCEVMDVVLLKNRRSFGVPE